MFSRISVILLVLHYAFTAQSFISIRLSYSPLIPRARASARDFDGVTFIEKSEFTSRRSLQWNEEKSCFTVNESNNDSISSRPLRKIKDYIRNTLRYSFLPMGSLSNDYFIYTTWRMLQRFLSATTSVFGTQSLLLALGVKSRIGIAAATTWVLKDALGKFSRIYWASKNGKRFDSDAKRWRFRSALLFTSGTLIIVFVFILINKIRYFTIKLILFSYSVIL
jgi:hypothetical protein